jgi:hypothetical protein
VTEAQAQAKLENLFPYKRRKAIEDWDFIMVFEEYYQQEVEMILESIRCRKKVKWKVVAHKEEKKSLFNLLYSHSKDSKNLFWLRAY